MSAWPGRNSSADTSRWMGGTRPSSDSELRGILGNVVHTFNARYNLMWKLAVTRTASVRSWRLNCSLSPVTARQMRARRTTADWNTRQPVTELSTTPVLANPAMKCSRHGHPQKMEMKTMIKVVILGYSVLTSINLHPSILL